MENLENFNWNEAVRKCFDSLDIDKHNRKTSLKCGRFAKPGLLEKVGYDFASIMMESNVEEVKKSQTKASLTPKPGAISKLTKSEHETYLRYLYNDTDKYRKAMPVALQKICTKIASEQQEFGKYAFQLALENIEMYNFVSPIVMDYLKKYISLACKRMERYAQQYSYRDTFPISCIPFTTDPIPQCLHVASMQKELHLQIPVSGEKISPLKLSEVSGHEHTTLYEDSEIMTLLPKWKPDIVICLSSVHALAGTLPPHRNEWEMPMVVKEILDTSGEIQQRRHVCFIEPTLLGKSLNPREINEIYFKKMVKFYLENKSKARDEQIPTASTEIVSPCSEPQVVVDVDTVNESSVTENQDTTCVEKASEPKQTTHESSSEFSHSDSEETCKNPTNADENKTSIDTFKNILTSPTCENLKSASESDNNELIIDDEISDESLIQVDGSNDRRPKTARKARKSITKPTAQVSTPVLETSKSAKKETDDKVKSDIWKKSFENEEKVTSFLSLRSKRPSIASLTAQLWQNKTSTPKAVPDESTSQSKDNDGDDEKDNSSASHESITYGVTSDPAFDVQLDAAASSTCADDQSLSVLPPKKARMSTRLSSRADSPESPTPSGSLVTRIRKRSARDSQNTDSDAAPAKRKRTRASSRIQQVTNVTYESADVMSDKSSDSDVTLGELRRKIDMVKSEDKEPEAEGQERQLRGRNMDSFPNPLAARLLTSKPAATKRTARKSTRKSTSAVLENKKSLPERKTSSSLPPEQPKPGGASSDILGQILGMQKSGNEPKTKPQKRDNNAAQNVCPTPLQSHETVLESKDGKSRFYSLWSFGDKRVLIRGSNHGYVTLNKNKNPHKSCAVVRTKLEYQSELGYEQITQLESAREWVDLRFRPQPVALLRCRVDPSKRKFVGVDIVKDMESLKESFTWTGFNVCKAAKLLTEAFNRLSNSVIYPVGSYLLSHKNESVEIMVRKGDPPEKAVIYDLKREYASLGKRVFVTAHTIPYIPLDPRKQLLPHAKSKRLAMTFEPLPDPPGTTRPKKKKNKGKKKKKSKPVAESPDE